MVMKYIKEPGYMFDLFFIFVLHFNREQHISDFVNPEKHEEDKAFFDEVLIRFGSFPEELYPFFFMKDKAKSFMMRRYFDAFESHFTEDYDLNTVQIALTDHEQVTRELLHYYFEQIDPNTFDINANSIRTVAKQIQSSKYSDKLKCSLYSFLIDPGPTIQTLSCTLAEKSVLLSEYYAKNYQKIVDFQAQLDTEFLVNTLRDIKILHADIDNKSVFCCSPCLLAKNYIKVFGGQIPTIVLGYDHRDILTIVAARKRIPALDILGTALSEPNRIDLLEFIHRNGEVTIKEIEQTLKIPGTTAYYHLNLMYRSGMLKTRVQKRTVFYSIDRSYFTMICEYLSKYTHAYKKEERT